MRLEKQESTIKKYNLSNDISQKVNLAESEPEKLQEMNSRFTEIRGEGYNKIKKLELKQI